MFSVETKEIIPGAEGDIIYIVYVEFGMPANSFTECLFVYKLIILIQ
jgi:hypothetical protein